MEKLVNNKMPIYIKKIIENMIIDLTHLKATAKCSTNKGECQIFDDIKGLPDGLRPTAVE
jgi:hypothetical protein